MTELAHQIALQGFKVRVDGDNIAIDVPGAGEGEVNGENFYSWHLQGRPMDGIVKALLAPLRQGMEFYEALDSWEYARKTVRMHLIPPQANLAGGCPLRDLVPGLLRYAYICDHPNFMSFVSQQLLDKWGIGLEELEQAARANMAQDAYATRGGPDVLAYFFDNQTCEDYTADLLLVPGLLQKHAQLLGASELVIAVPTRQHLIIKQADAASDPMLAMAAQMGYRMSDHVLTPQLLHWKDGQFSPWTPN